MRELLEENDDQLKQKPNSEIDQFTTLMFGKKKVREVSKEEGSEQGEHSSNRSHGIDDWFLGIRKKEPVPRTLPVQNQIEYLIYNLDYDLLMETINSFVTVTKPIQPLFKKVTPYFHEFRKKIFSKD